MPTPHEPTSRVRVDLSGRIVIPSDLRSQYGIGPGDELIVTAGPDALQVQTFQQIVRKAQAAFAPYRVEGVSVVDELIEDRRLEAARENEW